MKRSENGGRIVVVSGPSGCGKDSVVDELLRKRQDMTLSVSCTSREKRTYEIEGEHYYFISKEEFERLIDDGKMLEYAEYAGHYYGTSLAEIERKFEQDKTLILVIEINGADSIKRIYPDSLRVFIVPPSLEELRQRLRLRNTESGAEIEKRLEIAGIEMSHALEFDHVIINDKVEDCANKLMEIIADWKQLR